MAKPATSGEQRNPQLAHSAREMFINRLAKYNDPKNLEWDFEDVQDKWARHAYAAFTDLVDTEAERDEARKELQRLRVECQKLRETVQEFLSSGVEFEDERINYVNMQIDKATIKDAKELLAQLTSKE